MIAPCCPASAVVAAPGHLEQVPCNLCGAWDAALLYPGTIDLLDEQIDPQQVFACTSSHYGRYGPVVRCRRCGLVYLNPRLTAAAIEAAYEAVADTRYLAEREGRVHTFARALSELESVWERHGPRPAGPGRLLDVGCHIGVFLELAVQRGWDAEGVEPSRWAASCGRARGLRVRCSTLQGAALPSASYDVVTLWDVIEHFADPAAELREVWRLLRPGGLVGITTMNIDSLVARVLGPRWPWLMQMHLYYFSERTLRALLARCGFEVLAVRPHRRIVRVSYLLSRAERWLPQASRLAVAAAERLRLADYLVPIDLGDIITVYARRSEPHPSPNGVAVRR
ncbi:MAG: class I SAM-dependent methyltransferase [Chloroflexi bacterium]|nr:class I SAM-dependent methyltransferase [Chloroflexota bacterium]